ncbi:hypothetical protein VARIO8X_60289 [Burkholderiales bacterium 8X]|nr:hypothetical protein VARIO8X_60289 [Burkholderiales bacterium 8X]
METEPMPHEGRQSTRQRFEHRGWHVLVELVSSSSEGVVSAHAEVKDHGSYSCHLSITNQRQDPGEAMATLADRARALIDERLGPAPAGPASAASPPGGTR